MGVPTQIVPRIGNSNELLVSISRLTRKVISAQRIASGMLTLLPILSESVRHAVIRIIALKQAGLLSLNTGSTD
ncbi:MAG: hypothetical protein PsegKO_10620 [Pseudohongiellaceae bacterium]